MAENELIPVEAKREQILAEMLPPTQQVAESFQRKLTARAQSIVITYFNVGARLREVASKPEVYGPNAMKQLAAYLPLGDGKQSATALNDLKNFATVFSKTDVTNAFEKPMKNGQLLSYMHFRVVSRIASRPDRLRLLERAREECLSASQLETLIRAEFPTLLVNRSGGRNPKNPVSPLSGLQAGFSIAKRLSRYLGIMDVSVFERIEQMPAEQIEDNHLVKLEALKDQLVETAQQTEKALEDLVESEERVRRILETRQSGDIAPEVEEPFADAEIAAPMPTLAPSKRKKATAKRSE